MNADRITTQDDIKYRRRELDALKAALEEIRKLDYTRAATNMASYKAHRIACEALHLDEIREFHS